MAMGRRRATCAPSAGRGLQRPRPAPGRAWPQVLAAPAAWPSSCRACRCRWTRHRPMLAALGGPGLPGDLAGDRLWRRRASGLAGGKKSTRSDDRLRALHGRGRQGSRCRRNPQDRQYPPACGRCARGLAVAATRLDRSRVRPVSRPLAQDETPQAAPGQFRDGRGAGAGFAPGAELRLGTDIGDYAGQMLEVVLASGAFDWQANRRVRLARSVPPIGRPTRYEQKGIREGRRCAYLRFVRSAARG